MLLSIPVAERARMYANQGSATLPIDAVPAAHIDGPEPFVLRVSGPIDSWLAEYDHAFSAPAAIAAMDAASPTAIHAIIDSPGGLVSEGLTIYADLFARRLNGARVTAEVRGTAASAAVFPLMAATERVIVSEASRVMVHSPWTAAVVMGSEAAIDDQIGRIKAALRAATETYAAAIASATGADRGAIDGWMDGDTWFTGAEAVDANLATVLIAEPPEPEKPTAREMGIVRAIANFYRK